MKFLLYVFCAAAAAYTLAALVVFSYLLGCECFDWNILRGNMLFWFSVLSTALH